MPTAIQFEGVSKQYRLGQIGTGTISRDLERSWARMRGRPDPFEVVGTESSNKTGFVWALSDVSLEVQRGEVLGVIGRNGAGKSTLLKLLSRITAPTRGTIRVRGSIASLLEVGTGFHPELTGRENVFLNGAILGMKRAEVRRRLDEIVEFSGCSQYIDTPIKRYSSGMIVRLGFAVAAHLDCDTLVVDEVLAVGDFDFQRRCIDKMQEVAASGRTILLVSHNMTTMSRMCDRCAILSEGRLAFVGDTAAAIDQYLRESLQLPTAVDVRTYEPRSGSGRAKVSRFWIEDKLGDGCTTIASGDGVSFCFALQSAEPPVDHVDVRFSIHQSNGDIVTGMYSAVTGQQYSIGAGETIVRCEVPRLPLPEGRYTVAVRLVAGAEELDWPRGMIAGFDVVEGDFYGTGRLVSNRDLKFLIDARWSESASAAAPTSGHSSAADADRDTHTFGTESSREQR